MYQKKLVGAMLIALATSTTASAGQIIFTSYGGSYQSVQENTAVKRYRANTGDAIKTDTYNGGIAQIRSQVQTNNVTWDVVDLQLSDAIRACDEGLLVKVSEGDLAPGTDGSAVRDDFFANGISDCMVANVAWSTLITYNKDKFKGAQPQKVADFFDLKNFPGKRGLRKSPEGALEWALIADGVPVDQVYKTLATPAGVERAFRKLDTIKSSIVWWETGAQPPQLLADGEVSMVSAYNNRIWTVIVTDKKPFDFIWDGQLKNIQGYAIVKGTKNLKEAKAFLREATHPESLAALSSQTALGPMRKSSVPMIDEKVRPYLPTAAEHQKGALDVDPAFWADHSDDLNQKFAVWLGRK